MKELLNKISSYRILDYLVPGVVFIFLVQKITGIGLATSDIFTSLILCYFAGMSVSRAGSLVVGPLLRRIMPVKGLPYDEYYEAETFDKSITDRLADANAYRTFAALFIVLLLAIGADYVADTLGIAVEWRRIILCILLVVLYAASYIKQMRLLAKRIAAADRAAQKAAIQEAEQNIEN